MDILVTISCITYNQEKYIAQTLDSFLMQETDFRFEIVIHDDASTDNTANIIREYEKRYPDIIRAMYQTENQYSKGVTNPSGKFNYPRARGKYIAMCEGDDYWTDQYKLQKQVDYMESHPDCSFSFHRAKIEVVDGSYTDREVRPYKKTGIISSEEIIDKKSAYPTASLLFRREYIMPIPEFYTECPVGDIPLQLIFAACGYGYYIDEAMCVYRVGDSFSWSVAQKKGDYIKKQKIYFNEMKKMYLEFNEYSDYRFEDAIKSALKRLKYQIYVNTKNYEKIYAKKYRKYYKELNFRFRFFMGLEYRLPILYKLLRFLYFLGKR